MLKSVNKSWNSFEKKILKKFTKNQKELWELLVFLARFMVLAIPFHFLLWLNFNAYSLQAFTAEITKTILNALTSYEFIRDGVFVTAIVQDYSYTFEIIRDCIGWKSFLALSGLIFAVRGVPMKKRLLGVLIGLPVIFVGNIVRLSTTFYATVKFGAGYFDMTHSFLWQWGLVALVLGFFWMWLRKI